MRSVGVKISHFGSLFFCYLALVGCNTDISQSGSSSAGHTGPVSVRANTSGAAPFTAAMSVISTSCMGCHNGSSAPNFTSYLTQESAWVQAGYVIPGHSATSLLFRYLRGTGLSPGSMPPTSTLSSADLATIQTWIDQISSSSAGTATNVPDVNIPSGTLILPSQNFPRLGDRTYVKSVLGNIFGSDSSVESIIGPMVGQSLSTFGGACDPMGSPPATGQNSDTCANVDVTNFGAPVVPLSNAARSGLSMKVCNALVFNDIAIEYAIQQATHKTDLTYLQTQPIPTKQELMTAFDLFYPGRLQSPLFTLGLVSIDGIVGALTDIAQEAYVADYPACPAGDSNCQLDPWRYVFLALCYAPDWQVP